MICFRVAPHPSQHGKPTKNAHASCFIVKIVLMQDGITMEINNFYCKDIALSDLIIEDEFSSKTIDVLQVEASGLQIDCNGDFDAKRGRFLHISGTIDAKVSNVWRERNQ